MIRIAIAGFQHETNSFGPGRADLAAFEMADSWPGLLRGADVVTGTRGMNIPIAGFAAAAARHARVECIPVLWCAAEPCGPVTDRAFDTLSAQILEGLRCATNIDGLYLDLHGAMITESADDGEGELLARIRNLIGHKTPIAISLDLHANVTAQMVELADSLSIFRTYPHLDMAHTGARAFEALMRLIDGTRLARAFQQIPFLIPLHAQHTFADPARALYRSLDSHTTKAGAHVEMAFGFTSADMADTGPSIVAAAPSQEEAERLASYVAAQVLNAESRFDCTLYDPDEAIAKAVAMGADRPVILADVQDNSGAGASSDTTGLLAALIAQEAQGVLLGLMHDPQIAARAHRMGVGAIFDAALGGRHGPAGVAPYHGRFKVEALHDGRVAYTGEMYAGGVATLGPTAALRVLGSAADVQVVVSSVRTQCLDRAHFTHLGLEPEKARLLCVKSTAHFRADFEPIAAAVLCVAAPGASSCRPETIAYTRLRAGVRLIPAVLACCTR